MTITSLINQLQDERQKAAAQVERLTRAIKALNGVERGVAKAGSRKARFSAATRAKMARAQRARRRRERKTQ